MVSPNGSIETKSTRRRCCRQYLLWMLPFFLRLKGVWPCVVTLWLASLLDWIYEKIWTKFHYTSFPKGCELVGRYNRTSRSTETVWFPFILLSTYKQSAYIRTLCKRPNDHELCYLCGTICLFSPRRQAIRQYVCTMSLPHTISAHYWNIHNMSSNWRSRNQRQKGIKMLRRFKFTQIFSMWVMARQSWVFHIGIG